MDKTVLQKIGVSNANVQGWLNKGLTITYPIELNKNYFESEDGEAFIENADKYVPPLSQSETVLYTKHPEIFREVFLKNARFYVQFINWIWKIQPKTESLPKNDKLVSLLALLYLFQRGMDYHYFHFDRYLAYQNYPNTPVGYWWERLKDISSNVSLKIRPELSSDIAFLKLLSFDTKTLTQCKKILMKKRYGELEEILSAIKIFEDVQEKEVKTITDFETRENTFFRTAIPIWEGIKDMIAKYPELIKRENLAKVKQILEEHPIIAIRHMLIPKGLQSFRDDIIMALVVELSRWAKKK